MDVAILDTNYLKIRGKHGSLVVDPETAKSKSKIAADAILTLVNTEAKKFSNVENYRVVINRPGEYEVNGAMIAGKVAGEGIVYRIIIDNTHIILAKTSDIVKILDKIDSCQILILNVDTEEINQSIIGSLEPNVTLLYGEKKINGASSLGKKDLKPIQKFTLTKEKASEGAGIVLLG